MKSEFSKELKELRNKAEEIVLGRMKYMTGLLEEPFDATFYSPCNGLVLYTIWGIGEGEGILCMDETPKSYEDLQENYNAYMYVDEFSPESLCEWCDHLCGTNLKPMVEDIKSKCMAKIKDIPGIAYFMQEIEYVDSNMDFEIFRPTHVTKHAIYNDLLYLNYDDVELDSLCKIADYLP